jgi:hypothetical protein
MGAELLRGFTGEGFSIIVGSVDAEGRPASCRALAVKADDELTRLTVYLPVATAHETIANIATTQRLAVAAAHPIEHSCVQFKGSTRGVRMAGEEEGVFVRERLEKFTSLLEVVGIPRSLLQRINQWPAYAVDMNIEQLFDQTPGPNAGAQIL